MSSTISQATASPLVAACLAGDLLTMSPLLLEFKDSHPRSEQNETIFLLLAEATKNKHITLVGYLLNQTENTDYSRDLIFQAMCAGPDMVMLYLVKNPDIWKFEWLGSGNLLASALRQNQVELLTYLLEIVGADPGRSMESPRMAQIFFPLEWIAYSSTEDNARLLIKYGAMVKGTYALQMAAGSNRSKIGMVRLLMEAGADINSMPDFDDMFLGYGYNYIETALHCAAKTGTEEVVALLMEYGADSTKLDGRGYTAIELAEIHGRFELADLIRSYKTNASC
ncbi:hypothetical protein V500_05009 [Pseudogymnoascus sp. VKM F-4518 (FW-2643)]|nr:hypothetical protein V500_05009 [Pseudogymnoascus sp. VKM F-4518 (FW-2643)]